MFLVLLEIALSVDNIVFIIITSGRLPEQKRSIGRHVGIIGVFCTRIFFLCFVNYLTQMTQGVLYLGFHNFSVKEIIFVFGGVYLILKGLQGLFALQKERLEGESKQPKKLLKEIGEFQAVATIMLMDISFSIDSLITAVCIGNHLIVMILAVIIAIAFMFVFIDPVSNFIDRHQEMKMLALFFIFAIGVLMILENFELCGQPIPVLGMNPIKLVVYAAIFASFVMVLMRIRLKK
ncbi:MAG: TerC family protein [Eggerthellaceae bacterium]|nr:TerC family protein [Eggerthellaceae bacterium]